MKRLLKKGLCPYCCERMYRPSETVTGCAPCRPHQYPGYVPTEQEKASAVFRPLPKPAPKPKPTPKPKPKVKDLRPRHQWKPVPEGWVALMTVVQESGVYRSELQRRVGRAIHRKLISEEDIQMDRAPYRRILLRKDKVQTILGVISPVPAPEGYVRLAEAKRQIYGKESKRNSIHGEELMRRAGIFPGPKDRIRSGVYGANKEVYLSIEWIEKIKEFISANGRKAKADQ